MTQSNDAKPRIFLTPGAPVPRLEPMPSDQNALDESNPWAAVGEPAESIPGPASPPPSGELNFESIPLKPEEPELPVAQSFGNGQGKAAVSDPRPIPALVVTPAPARVERAIPAITSSIAPFERQDELPQSPSAPDPNSKAKWAGSLGATLRILLQSNSSSSVVAWATSIAFHVIIFATAILVVPPLVKSMRAPSKEQIIIPDAQLASDADIGGVPNPGLGKDPSRQASQENDPTATDAHGWAERRSDNLAAALSGSAIPTNDQLDAGTSTARGKDNSVINLFGGSDGQTANFGPRGGGQGAGPRSKIFGHGSNVRSIIYVCDGSGSLVGGKDDVLRMELKRDIANLSPIQAFNVIIFQENHDGTEYQALSDHLMMASPSNQSRVFSYLEHDLTFHGDTNPVPALKEAFHENPQLIFLLTDGEFDNPSGDEVLSRIEEGNSEKRVHINTVLLLGSKKERDLYKNFETIMNEIAVQNGGVYKKFYADDF